MKKIFQLFCLLILFSVVYYGCRKDNTPSGQIYTPYSPVINPPDSFLYYVSLNYNAVQKGTIQFNADGVWHITKIVGMSTNTWLSRADTPLTYNITFNDTVALQGNYPYYLTASNPNLPDGVKIYLNFSKTKIDYQSFRTKY